MMNNKNIGLSERDIHRFAKWLESKGYINTIAVGTDWQDKRFANVISLSAERVIKEFSEDSYEK